MNQPRSTPSAVGFLEAVALAFLLASPLAAQCPPAPCANPNELYVSTQSGADNRAGDSPAAAIATLCEAISRAKASPDCDVIHVAEGVYQENLIPDSGDPRDPNLGCSLVDDNGAGIHLIGGFNEPDMDQQDPDAFVTEIDALFSDRVVVVGVLGTPASNVCVDGFTLENGISQTQDPFGRGSGAGLMIYHSSVTLTRNRIQGNRVSQAGGRGGGLAIKMLNPADTGDAAECPTCAPPDTVPIYIANNYILNNEARGGYGGGIAVYDSLVNIGGSPSLAPDASRPVIRNNRILNNRSLQQVGQGRFGAHGGGIWVANNRAVLDDNEIVQNYATGTVMNDSDNVPETCEGTELIPPGTGGGLGVIRSAAVITSNLIEGNIAEVVQDPTNDFNCSYVATGGGAYFNAFAGEFRGNQVLRNETRGGTGFLGDQGIAQAMGGGVMMVAARALDGTPPKVTQNIIAENSTSGGGNFSGSGGGAYLYSFEGEFSDNLFEQNQGGGDGGGLASIQCIDIDRCPPGDAVFNSNVIRNNTAAGEAAGLLVATRIGNPSVTLRNFQVQSNIPPTPSDLGGVLLAGFPIVTNMDVSGNEGNGLRFGDEAVGVGFSNAAVLRNVSLVNNTGIGLVQDNVVLGATFHSGIIWGNGTSALDRGSGAPFSNNLTVEFSNVEGGVPAGGLSQGNQSEVPLFQVGDLGDYYLSHPLPNNGSVSPSVDGGRPRAVDIGIEAYRTTRTDGGPDWCLVDQGFHYPPSQDTDLDTVPDAYDNCPNTPNEDQADADLDCVGDACDDGTDDHDGDGILNADDLCPFADDAAQGDDDLDGARIPGDPIADCSMVFDPMRGGNACDLDDDGDLAPDLDEDALGLDRTAPDSDLDGIPDGGSAIGPFGMCECAAQDVDGDGLSNALDCDSDNDGIPDSVESGLSPAQDPGAGSCFVADADLGATQTNPCSMDTDNGGEPDSWEDANQDGAPDGGESDPLDAADDDTDNDGLLDADEAARGTNPLDADTDNDGISDGEEVVLGTNPLDCDSDRDGVNDGTEVGVSVPVDCRDTNGDGSCQDELIETRGTDELAVCLNRVTGQLVFSYRPDQGPETTDPTDADSDGGGCPDGIEDTNGDGNLDAGEGDPRNAADDSTSCPGPTEPFPMTVRREGADVLAEFETSFGSEFYRLYRGTLEAMHDGDEDPGNLPTIYDHRVSDGADPAGDCCILDGPGVLEGRDVGAMDVDAGDTDDFYYLIVGEESGGLQSPYGFGILPSQVIQRPGVAPDCSAVCQ